MPSGSPATIRIEIESGADEDVALAIGLYRTDGVHVAGPVHKFHTKGTGSRVVEYRIPHLTLASGVYDVSGAPARRPRAGHLRGAPGGPPASTSSPIARPTSAAWWRSAARGPSADLGLTTADHPADRQTRFAGRERPSTACGRRVTSGAGLGAEPGSAESGMGRMALIVDRSPYDNMDDGAIQVVDLDDIVVSTITTSEDDLLPAARAIAAAWGSGASSTWCWPSCSAWRCRCRSPRSCARCSPTTTAPDVDIEDGRRELPADLEAAHRADDPPVPDLTTPPTTAATPAVDTDPGGKAAFQAAAPTGPPGTAPAAPTTTAPPATTSTAPPTTASPPTTTPSVTLRQVTQPAGAQAARTAVGSTTTMQDPFGDDIIPGG